MEKRKFRSSGKPAFVVDAEPLGGGQMNFSFHQSVPQHGLSPSPSAVILTSSHHALHSRDLAGVPRDRGHGRLAGGVCPRSYSWGLSHGQPLVMFILTFFVLVRLGTFRHGLPVRCRRSTVYRLLSGCIRSVQCMLYNERTGMIPARRSLQSRLCGSLSRHVCRHMLCMRCFPMSCEPCDRYLGDTTRARFIQLVVRTIALPVMVWMQSVAFPERPCHIKPAPCGCTAGYLVSQLGYLLTKTTVEVLLNDQRYKRRRGLAVNPSRLSRAPQTAVSSTTLNEWTVIIGRAAPRSTLSRAEGAENPTT